MIGAAVLLLFVVAVGPTLFILNGFVENLGLYLNDFFYLALWNETYSAGDWQNAWTVFYWGWWIAWSPFVGMFIARVSRGRTIRQFVAGVLLVPTLLTFLWLSIFGDAAMYFELFKDGGIATAAQENLTTSLFVFLDTLPGATFTGGTVATLATLSGVLATLIIITFATGLPFAVLLLLLIWSFHRALSQHSPGAPGQRGAAPEPGDLAGEKRG
ncbi:hypothetical protein CKO31_08050 [Thiohalocapsa halophila]|uniref:BCCT family transporter n=1 Tax=Thiohalocapsa halophila TaxID=69359 RepID=A0ABS1CFK9_9GAMM|nr:BCCT family transporter [Thiohalocapsa halophila]MBK1630695.1 hypothetical protein [Thiohalocapsa halophila]